MILINVTFLNELELRNRRVSTGVGLFLKGVLDGIQLNGQSQNYCLITSVNCQQDVIEMFPGYKVFSFLRLKGEEKIPLIKWLNELFYNNLLAKLKAEAVWYPFATPHLVYKSKVNSILTIHDLIKLHNDSTNCKLKKSMLRMIEKGDLIIAISDFVKQDIQKMFGDSFNIKVIPNPVECQLRDTNTINPIVRTPYILDVNAYQKRKNPKTLIDAFNRIKSFINLDLVFCGGDDQDGMLESLQKYTDKLGCSDRVLFFFAVSNEERNWLMKNASVFVSPTTSEGFGRTPIEAAIFRTPVLCTKVDSLFEVTQGKLNYYNDPLDTDELANCLLKIINNPIDSEELEKIGAHFEEFYSIKNIAKQYIDVFNPNMRM